MSFIFSLSHRKWPSALAILAMLMLFIAPLISKSLAHHRMVMPGEPQMIMHPDNRVMDMGGKEIPTASHFLPAPGASPREDIACEYCQLLLHIPLIVWLFIPFIWLLWRISRAPVPPILAPLLAQHDDAEALPRAPPVAVIR